MVAVGMETIGLRLAFLHQIPEQLLCQDLGRRRANLFALAAHAGGDGQDLSCNPIGSLIRLAINLAGDPMARWILVHRVITFGDRKR